MRWAGRLRAAVVAMLLASVIALPATPVRADPNTADDELVLVMVPWHRDFCQLVLRGNHLEPSQAYEWSLGWTTAQFYARANGTLLGRWHDGRGSWNSDVVTSAGAFTFSSWNGSAWVPWAPSAILLINACSP